MGVADRSGNAPDASSPLDILKESFPGKIMETSLPQGDATARVVPESIREIMEFLKNDGRLLFDMLVDVTAVDYFGRNPRFEVVYHLLSLPFNRRLRVKVQLPGENPVLDSLSALWGNADWLEREVWDMFGVRFAGHPNLKRILLYEEFEGHPLRKDYPIQKRQPLIGPKD
jgi:NADH-quinone oxidoreductase subunit C